MNINNALAKVANGDAITRQGWADAGRRVDVYQTPYGQVIGLPYTVDGDGVPLFLTAEDLQATDWAVIE